VFQTLSNLEMSSGTQKQWDVAIIGGGIAGMALAIGLINQKIPVTVYESAHHFGEIGAGVAFGPNARKAMELLDPRVYEALQRIATYNQSENKKNIWLDFKFGQDIGPNMQAGKEYHSVECPGSQAAVHRAQFMEELVKLVPDDVGRFGKKFIRLEDLGAEGIRLHFQDGTTATHSAVVGADGIHSEVRKCVLGPENPESFPVFSQKYCHRGLVPMDKAIEALGEESAMNGKVYTGKGGHIITFPVQQGKTMNMVGISSREKWDSDDWVLKTSKDDLFSDYKGWSGTVQKIIGLLENTDIWALFDSPPTSTYYKKRICIIGDAAHATTPHQGAGAGMAIEDAYVLSNLLGEVKSPNSIEAAFKAFDAVRRERTQKLVSTSRDASHLWDTEDLSMWEDLGKVRDTINARMDWIWNEDLTAEVEKGKNLIRA
jgi:salicylate hydroxylase